MGSRRLLPFFLHRPFFSPRCAFSGPPFSLPIALFRDLPFLPFPPFLPDAISRSVVRSRGVQSIGYFWATWCEPTSFLDAALTTLSASAPDVTVVRVEAEEVPEVTEEADVTAVPTFVMYAAGKPTGERVEGPKIAEVSAWVLAKHRGGEAQGEAKGKHEAAPGALSSLPGLVAPPPGGAAPPPSASPAPASSAGSAYATESALRALTRRSPVMLFMKGSPSAPRCGFSRRTAQALTDAGVEFGSFDILSDETVRQGLKKLSDWPTFPQLYVQGQLVGGCDIVEELASTDTLKQEIADMLRDADGAAGGLQDVADAHDGKTEPETTGNGGKVSIELAKRIRKILESAPVVLFMKGTKGRKKKATTKKKAKVKSLWHLPRPCDAIVRCGRKKKRKKKRATNRCVEMPATSVWMGAAGLKRARSKRSCTLEHQCTLLRAFHVRLRFFFSPHLPILWSFHSAIWREMSPRAQRPSGRSGGGAWGGDGTEKEGARGWARRRR